MSVSIGELIRQAQTLEYLDIIVNEAGPEKAVRHMTTEQFNLLTNAEQWADYVPHLTDDQIASLEPNHLTSMGSKVSEIQNINKIRIEGDANSPFMSIEHDALTQKQVESLDVPHIQQLIENNELASLKDNVQHLNAEELANAASNIDGITIDKLALDNLSQEQINALISRKDTDLDQLDLDLQKEYVAEGATEAVAEGAALSAGTIIAIAVVAIIALAMMFEIFREK